ncbi:hypothetical protein D9M73_199990 [compost metagenome]
MQARISTSCSSRPISSFNSRNSACSGVSRGLMPPWGNCQASWLMRRAHSTCPASLDRMMPTFGRKPSESITAGHPRNRMCTHCSTKLVTAATRGSATCAGRPKAVTLGVFSALTNDGRPWRDWLSSISTTPSWPVTATTPGATGCAAAGWWMPASTRHATTPSMRTTWPAGWTWSPTRTSPRRSSAATRWSR